MPEESFSITFNGVAKTITPLVDDTTITLADKIAELDVTGWRFTHPVGTSYVICEALSNTISDAPTISSDYIAWTTKRKAENKIFVNSYPHLIFIEGERTMPVIANQRYPCMNHK